MLLIEKKGTDILKIFIFLFFFLWCSKTHSCFLTPSLVLQIPHQAEGPKKCLVLDGDGVLWTGILGEVGVEGIKPNRKFQEQVKELQRQGVILAINSSNNPDDIEQVFARCADMILTKEDFAIIKANWGDKATNIKEIAQELNIALGSLVFIDDTGHVRERVRTIFPEVETPEFYSDQESYVKVYIAPFFKQETITREDRRRTELYEIKDSRQMLLKKIGSEEDFFRALEMKIFIREGEANIPYIGRIAEITQRTNQFNLTLKRYTINQIEQLFFDSRYRIFTVELLDIFGNNGIVGLIILNKTGDHMWDIDTFCLSCRAIGLTIERAFLSTVISLLREPEEFNLTGFYVAGPRNTIVKNLYAKFGFQPLENISDQWIYSHKTLSIPSYIKIQTLSFLDTLPFASNKLGIMFREWLVSYHHLYHADSIGYVNCTARFAFLSFLQRICRNEDRFRKALAIDIALAGLALHVNIITKGTYYCSDYEGYIPAYGLELYFRSVMKKLFEIMDNDVQKMMQFIDTWGEYCKEKQGDIIEFILYRCSDPWLEDRSSEKEAILTQIAQKGVSSILKSSPQNIRLLQKISDPEHMIQGLMELLRAA